jgi:hypothetical protein
MIAVDFEKALMITQPDIYLMRYLSHDVRGRTQ